MRLFTVFCALIMLSGCSSGSSEQQSVSVTNKQIPEKEQFRPVYHFTPEANWMNDPNGMIYYEGEYHLFYQYHPESTVWGPMHWGHAISKDMVSWEHQPIALYPDKHGTIFSGSAVLDKNNTSGLGSTDNPPMIAIFTYHDAAKEKAGNDDFQTQGIAYSLDKGRSWKKYEQNPVLNNPGMKVFRDPKVSWYEPQQKWVMMLAQGDHIGIYSSQDLLTWQHESDFGHDWGEHGGVWECPDLIRMKIEDSDEYRDVLLVSIYPGAPNGGSGTQYFVGNFDGKHFTLSPEYQKRLEQSPASFPNGEVFESFESDFSQWTTQGNAFSEKPNKGGYKGQNSVENYIGMRLANSFNEGDHSTGKLISKPFTITSPYINFFVGGGGNEEKTAINLIIDGLVVRSAAGSYQEKLNAKSWTVDKLIGKQAHIEIVDNAQGAWGHILVDQITFSEEPAYDVVEPSLWIDYGTDNYAGVTFSNFPEEDDRWVLMGWSNNWYYANQIPSQSWRGTMTLPRELLLRRSNQGLILASQPIAELRSLSRYSESLKNPVSGKQIAVTKLVTADISASRTTFKLIQQSATEISLSYSNSQSENTTLTFDLSAGKLRLSRKMSGKTDFHDHFSKTQIADLNDNQTEILVDIFYDDSIFEIFVNDGELVMTTLVFPAVPYDTITLSANDEITVPELTISELSVNQY